MKNNLKNKYVDKIIEKNEIEKNEDTNKNEDIYQYLYNKDDDDINKKTDTNKIFTILEQLEEKKDEYFELRKEINNNLNSLEKINKKLDELENKILKEKNEEYINLYKNEIKNLIEKKEKIIQSSKENIESFLSFFEKNYKNNKEKFDNIEEKILNKKEKTEDDKKVLLLLNKIDKYDKIINNLLELKRKFDIDIEEDKIQKIIRLENELYKKKLKKIKDIDEFKKIIKEYELFLIENWSKLWLDKEKQKEILVNFINDFKERLTNEKRIIKETKENIKENIDEIKEKVVSNEVVKKIVENKTIKKAKKIKDKTIYSISKINEWILKKYNLTDYNWDYNDLLLDFFVKFIIFMIIVYYLFKIDFIAQFTKIIYWF